MVGSIFFLLFVLSAIHLLGVQIFDMQGADNFAWTWFGIGAGLITVLSIVGIVMAIDSGCCMSAGKVAGQNEGSGQIGRGCANDAAGESNADPTLGASEVELANVVGDSGKQPGS